MAVIERGTISKIQSCQWRSTQINEIKDLKRYPSSNHHTGNKNLCGSPPRLHLWVKSKLTSQYIKKNQGWKIQCSRERTKAIRHMPCTCQTQESLGISGTSLWHKNFQIVSQEVSHKAFQIVSQEVSHT